jgi:hypothetical protein
MQQIHCDQCGRALIPTAATTIVCPSCGYAAIVPAQAIAGAHVAYDDSATRPVPPEVAAASSERPAPLADQERPTLPPPPPVEATTQTASPLGTYAPPSLPRSRADAPAEPIPPGGDELNERSNTTPTALLRGHDPLHDTRPVDGSAVQAALVKGSKRGPLAMLSALALLLVLALGTAAAVLAANGRLNDIFAPFVPAATPTAIPTATAGPPPPPAGFTRYTAPDGTFTLVVPNSWSQGTSNQPVLFTDPSRTIYFEIQSVSSQLDSQTATQDFLSKFGPASPGATQLGPLTQDSVLVAGIAWARTAVDITVTSSGNVVPWHVNVLATQHDGKTLLIAYFSPRSLFASEDTAHFQVMLDSLLLLSPRP